MPKKNIFTQLQTFEDRKIEAWQKAYEILEEARDKADYIGMEDKELFKRYMSLAQRAWPDLWHKPIDLCPICQGGLYFFSNIGIKIHFQCIECKTTVLKDRYDNSLEVVKFCPICQARMDKLGESKGLFSFWCPNCGHERVYPRVREA